MRRIRIARILGTTEALTIGDGAFSGCTCDIYYCRSESVSGGIQGEGSVYVHSGYPGTSFGGREVTRTNKDIYAEDIYAVCGIDPATSFTEETSGVPETSDALETTEALGTTDIAEVDTGPGKSNRMIALIVGVVVAIVALVVVVLLLLWLFVFRKKRGQHADENEVELADETFYGTVEDTEPSVFDNVVTEGNPIHYDNDAAQDIFQRDAEEQ